MQMQPRMGCRSDCIQHAKRHAAATPPTHGIHRHLNKPLKCMKFKLVACGCKCAASKFDGAHHADATAHGMQKPLHTACQ